MDATVHPFPPRLRPVRAALNERAALCRLLADKGGSSVYTQADARDALALVG